MIINTKIKEHKKMKPVLLNLIKEMPNVSDVTVTKSDWTIPKETPRHYLSVFHNLMRPYMDKMAKRFRCSSWIIHNTWYHQYKKGSDFGWHIHPACHFTNVYFLDLPDQKEVTEIFDEKYKLMKVEAKEGDLITFPGFYLHRAPKVKTHKTAIVFNSSVEKLTNKKYE